ncbi:MAG: hypothetical protein ABSG80_14705, partial [Verrucomicrobiota bacterium]
MKRIHLVVLLAGAMALSASVAVGQDEPDGLTTFQCTVDATNIHQRIDGFGACSAWDTSYTDAQLDMFFSTNNGIGLSLLRNRIAPASTTSQYDTPTTTEISIMQGAQQRGALVWSAPWTPASGFKNNNLPYGGSYLGGHANDLAYARQLANYVLSMKNQSPSINIYAISVQNEPDVDTGYESCEWTSQQFHDFVTNLNNALVANGVGSTKIMIPESYQWSGDGLFTSTLNDTNTAAVVSIIANHDYSTCPPSGTPTQLSTSGQAVWQTETCKGNWCGFNTFDNNMDDAIFWATRIHLFLTAAEANAWHYWWLISDENDDEGLTDSSGNPALRMYVLGNYSRFVRPGYYRIDATNNLPCGLVSAFMDTNSGTFAIVAVNTNLHGSYTMNFNLVGLNAASVTPWRTSSTQLSTGSLPPIGIVGASFQDTLPNMSVTTYVGQSLLAPTGLTATAGCGQVALSWTASSGATSYNVYRSTTPNDGSYTEINSSPITATTYTDTTGVCGTTYYYVVTVVSGGVESVYSSPVSAAPLCVPAPPTGLTGTPGNNQVALSWIGSSGAASYNVKRSTVNGGPYATTIGISTGTSYTDITAANGNIYYYVVSAVSSDGCESVNSSQAGPYAPGVLT